MSYKEYSSLQVLAVDDFKQFLDTLAKILKEFGVTKIDVASSVNQALHCCKIKKYDLILCDYNLGENAKNGRYFLEKLRQQSNNSHTSLFILITAEISKSMVMATYDSEPDDYLTKPFNAKTLKLRLDRLLTKYESMRPVHEALCSKEYNTVISLCKNLIENQSRYALECKKILAETYITTQDYDLAEELYNSTLEKRPIEWAVLGTSRIQFLREQYEDVIDTLTTLLESNPNCLAAYDIIADAYEKLQKPEQSQHILQEVTRLSPLSLQRQQHLGEIAEKNHDLDVASTAFLRSTQLGTHSIHDKVENHLNFGKTTAALLAENNDKAGTLAEKALKTLRNVSKNYDSDANLDTQLLLIESEVHEGLKDHEKASHLIEKAENIIKENRNAIDIETKLELAHALSANGQNQRSEATLKDLVRQHKDDEAALEKIDKHLEAPKSQANKKRVAAINREGIGLYEKKNFIESIQCFEQAAYNFPKHSGIHLNLAQAILGELKENTFSFDLLDKCGVALNLVEESISESNEQYSRYQKLNAKYQELKTLNFQQP